MTTAETFGHICLFRGIWRILPDEILNFEVQNADSNFDISFDLNRKEALFESKSWKVRLKIILNSAFQKFLDMRKWVCQK